MELYLLTEQDREMRIILGVCLCFGQKQQDNNYSTLLVVSSSLEVGD